MTNTEAPQSTFRSRFIKGLIAFAFTAIIVVVLVLVAQVVSAFRISDPNEVGHRGSPLVSVDAPSEDTTSPVFDCLLNLGYRGDPNDGAERLYVTSADLKACTEAFTSEV